jgi:hypothetical protein
VLLYHCKVPRFQIENKIRTLLTIYVHEMIFTFTGTWKFCNMEGGINEADTSPTSLIVHLWIYTAHWVVRGTQRIHNCRRWFLLSDSRVASFLEPTSLEPATSVWRVHRLVRGCHTTMWENPTVNCNSVTLKGSGLHVGSISVYSETVFSSVGQNSADEWTTIGKYLEPWSRSVC